MVCHQHAEANASMLGLALSSTQVHRHCETHAGSTAYAVKQLHVSSTHSEMALQHRLCR